MLCTAIFWSLDNQCFATSGNRDEWLHSFVGKYVKIVSAFHVISLIFYDKVTRCVTSNDMIHTSTFIRDMLSFSCKPVSVASVAAPASRHEMEYGNLNVHNTYSQV